MKQLPSTDIKKDDNLIEQESDKYQKLSPQNNSDKITKGNFKKKFITGALLLSILPVIVLGATSYFKNQSIEAKISPSREGELAYVILYQQSIWLLLATGTIAGLTGTIAFMLADRLLDPIVKSAAASAKIVDRLLRENNLSDTSLETDELGSLVNNLNLLEQKLPDLLWQQEVNQENFHVLMEMMYCLQRSRSVEEVYRNTVEETRRLLRADRVTILQIELDNTGTFVEESVAPRLPKILWTTVEELDFELEYLEDYQRDHVRAINNIYQANLSDRYLSLLERFAVKANLIAPIKCCQRKQLLGLLIAHQCHSFRNWQIQEIELITHIAQQIGFSLEHTQLLEQSDAKAEQAHQFIELTHRIRGSLNETEVLNTTVRELRKELRADRVVVYSFNYDWSGYISAESVLSGWPHALDNNIKDPCIPQHLLQAYIQDRIVPTDNVDEANLHPDHLELMKQLEVKANLVAPILNNGHLFGLLIAHQCSAPRQWLQSEINLFSQIAIQVGFAIDHARLLAKVEAEGERIKLLEDITRCVWTSLKEEDILANGVEEVRKFLNCDRVIVYNFDEDWNGKIIAESVLAGFPQTLNAQITDPCFAKDYAQQYEAGRVHVIDNIYEAELTDCHLKQLETFEVKANLVAPIVQDEKLLGLLIAHQCSAPRFWQDWEINLFTQIGTQIGFALARARLVEKLEAESRQSKLIADISRRIRVSLVEENVLKTTVKEVRKAINCDRVIVYSFDQSWYGTVVAESVVPGFPKSLWSEVQDSCFAERYAEKYQAGRIQATDNIYTAGLTDCYIKELENFEVKANLVVPILKENRLFGLLIAHQCSAPRCWQEWEINFMSSIANQVSFALEHCRLLDQTEESYQQIETIARQRQKEKETIINQISELLNRSENITANLSNQNLTHKEAITAISEQIQAITNNVVELTNITQQAELEEQKWLESFADSQSSWSKAVSSERSLRTNTSEISTKIKHLIYSSQELLQILNTIGDRIAQLKLEGMNGVLEAARSQETSKKFAAVSQKIHNLAQQLDQELLEIQPLASAMQTNVQEINSMLEQEETKRNKVTDLQEETQQKLNQVDTANQKISKILTQISQATTQQAKILEDVSNSLLVLADFDHQENEESQQIITSFNELKVDLENLKVTKNN